MGHHHCGDVIAIAGGDRISKIPSREDAGREGQQGSSLDVPSFRLSDKMELPRGAGILLHPTSLPGPYGIGDLGPEAYAFVDFLIDAGQSLWQMLPLGPTDNGNSPYASYSAFAGNTLLISPDQLVLDGLLTKEQLPTPS